MDPELEDDDRSNVYERTGIVYIGRQAIPPGVFGMNVSFHRPGGSDSLLLVIFWGEKPFHLPCHP